MLRKVKGIALLQVLLISAIISVLALYLSHTARDQIQIAGLLDGKNQALVNLYDTEAIILFGLLTSPLKESTAKEQLNGQWNFYGKSFDLSPNIRVSIQDNAGLLNLNSPGNNVLKKWLLSQGKSLVESDVIANSLADWQDSDSLSRLNGAENDYYQKLNYRARNKSMVLESEIGLIRGVEKPLLLPLKSIMSPYTASYFNPLNSPDLLLNALYPTGKDIVNKRALGEVVTINEFKAITGEQESEGLMLFTSNFLTLTIDSRYQNSRASKTIEFKIDRYAQFGQPVLEQFVTKWH